MYCGEYSTTMTTGWYYPISDYPIPPAVVDFDDREIVRTREAREAGLSERAHMLRKKWLPHRPKKMRWRKG